MYSTREYLLDGWGPDVDSGYLYADDLTAYALGESQSRSGNVSISLNEGCGFVVPAYALSASADRTATEYSFDYIPYDYIKTTTPTLSGGFADYELEYRNFVYSNYLTNFL